MTKKDAPTTSDLVTRRALATQLGVHPQTITKWESEGMPLVERGGQGVRSGEKGNRIVQGHG